MSFRFGYGYAMRFSQPLYCRVDPMIQKNGSRAEKEIYPKILVAASIPPDFRTRDALTDTPHTPEP